MQCHQRCPITTRMSQHPPADRRVGDTCLKSQMAFRLQPIVQGRPWSKQDELLAKMMPAISYNTCATRRRRAVPNCEPVSFVNARLARCQRLRMTSSRSRIRTSHLVAPESSCGLTMWNALRFLVFIHTTDGSNHLLSSTSSAGVQASGYAIVPSCLVSHISTKHPVNACRDASLPFSQPKKPTASLAKRL